MAAIGKASIVRFKQSAVKASDPPSADGRIGIMMCGRNFDIVLDHFTR